MFMTGNSGIAGRDGDVGRFARAVCSLVLVAGLCWPVGLSFADGGAAPDGDALAGQGAAAAEAGAAAGPDVAAGVAGAADAPAAEGAPDAGDAPEDAGDRKPSERYDVERILREAREAELAGLDELERFLNDEELEAEDLLKIDAEALKGISEDLAKEIADLQEAAVADGAAEPAEGGGAVQVVAEGDAPAAAEPEDAGAVAPAKEPSKPEATQEGEGNGYPEWSYGGDATLEPRRAEVNLTTVKFIAVIGEQARDIARDNDLYASVMIAQAIVESGSGGSGLARAPYNNLFGIKGSYRGASVTMGTMEDDGTGGLYPISAAFRRYPSWRESLRDYADLLSSPLYGAVHRAHAVTPADACDALQGVYATSTSYSATLQAVIDTYDLTRYDEPRDYELVGSYLMLVPDDDAPEGAVPMPAIDPRVVPEGFRLEERGLSDLAAEATSHLGCPYVWGATGPDSFDCSGLVQTSYADALGVQLPRTTHYQCLLGEDVDFRDLHAGDLLFFADDEGVVGHVAMYLGEGCYVESTAGGVQVTGMEERTPTFAKRVLPTRDNELAGMQRVGDALRSAAASALGRMALTPLEQVLPTL